MAQPTHIIPPKHIQLESLLDLAMLSQTQFEQLILHLSKRGGTAGIAASGDAVNEKVFQVVAEAYGVS